MPSPLTATYQFAIEPAEGSPVVFGHDSPVPEVSLLKVSGLGSQVVAQASPRAMAPGAAVGVDTPGTMPVKLDVEIFTPGDDEDAGAWWLALSEAFAAVEEGAALRKLWVWLPGIGHRELQGRPRGVSDDGLVSLPHGYIEMTLAFDVTTGSLGEPIVEEEP